MTMNIMFCEHCVCVESTTQSCRKELCELTDQDESLRLVAWCVRKGWPEHKIEMDYFCAGITGILSRILHM